MPDKYKVDFKITLKECELFSQLYSEIIKFVKEMIRKDLIEAYKIRYE